MFLLKKWSVIFTQKWGCLSFHQNSREVSAIYSYSYLLFMLGYVMLGNQQ